jgi:hypothetical protein
MNNSIFCLLLKTITYRLSWTPVTAEAIPNVSLTLYGLIVLVRLWIAGSL